MWVLVPGARVRRADPKHQGQKGEEGQDLKHIGAVADVFVSGRGEGIGQFCGHGVLDRARGAIGIL